MKNKDFLERKKILRQMQDSDALWYEENYASISKKWGKGYLAVKNKQVLGKYKDFSTAYQETIKNEEDGSFIIQKCNGKKKFYIEKFYINVISLS